MSMEDALMVTTFVIYLLAGGTVMFVMACAATEVIKERLRWRREKLWYEEETRRTKMSKS